MNGIELIDILILTKIVAITLVSVSATIVLMRLAKILQQIAHVGTRITQGSDVLFDGVAFIQSVIYTLFNPKAKKNQHNEQK